MCEVVKPLDDFYAHPKGIEGKAGKCKECAKFAANKNRWANIEKNREYDRARGSLPHRVDARARYAKTEVGKLAHKKGRGVYRKRYPEKMAATSALNNAVRDGRVAKPLCCESCGNDERLQGHHDDYSKKLDVRWLCILCHNKVHEAIRIQERS